MSKNPAFQFYPADWLNDIKLQSCSLEAQGLLINLMCLMHQSNEYGYLLVNGHNPSNKEVSHLLRLHHNTYHARLQELLLYGVLKKDENDIIFCERMIKDEYIRNVRREAGKLGGSPLLKQKVKQVFKQKPTPSSSSSSSSSSSKIIKDIYMDCVFLTKDEHQKLIERDGNIVIEKAIEVLNNYKMASGKKYKSDYHALLNWAVEKAKNSFNQPKGKENYNEPGKQEAEQILAAANKRFREEFTKRSAISKNGTDP